MQIDQLNVTLRERSNWEAIELGTALVRRDARAVWGVWLLASLPLFVLFNALAWWRDGFWWALLAMWWCKPLFERGVLYVLSRSVFGEHTGALQALRGQYGWGKGLWGFLGWRRFSPMRNVSLAVNLLEDADAAHRARRRRAVLSGVGGSAMLLSTFCLVFEGVLVVACISLFFLMVPVPLLTDAWRDAWDLIQYELPAGLQLARNAVVWAAASVMSPFNIGAGFGLYLARRTQMEAWDVEISFRRLRERLQRSGVSAALLMAFALPMALLSSPLQAQQQPQPQAKDAASPDARRAALAAAVDLDPENTAAGIFGDAPVDTAGFRQAVQRAYEDPLQRPVRRVTQWVPRNVDEPVAQSEVESEFLERLFKAIRHWSALLAESGLWLIVGALVIAALATMKYWLPWLRGSGRRMRPTPQPVQESETPVAPPALPADAASLARRLWQQGLHREALALLYRACVESIAKTTGKRLPPGATEAQVLRASRQLPDNEDRQLAARTVRMWQYAAYAARLPSTEAFDQLADELQQRFRWLA